MASLANINGDALPSILDEPFLLPPTMITTNPFPPEIHAESNEEDLRKIGPCKLVDMAEDTKDADFVDDNDDQKSQKSQMVKPNSG